MSKSGKSVSVAEIDDTLPYEILKKPNQMLAVTRFATDLLTLTYSVRGAAAILGIGRESAYLAIREGRLKALKLGAAQGRWRVPKTELEAFIQRELERTDKK